MMKEWATCWRGLAVAIVVLACGAGCENGDNSPGVSQTPQGTGAARVIFSSYDPSVEGRNLGLFWYAAAFDEYYLDPPHWRITEVGGFIDFSFNNARDFSFVAQGATVEGISLCRIRLWVNDLVVWWDLPVEVGWQTYRLPATAMGNGRTRVRVELTGSSHLWIREAWTSTAEGD